MDGDQQTVDLKRQLQLVEQEATILRTKTQTLESENETLMNENRKLQMMRNTKRGKSVEGDSSSVIELKEKIKTLENEINESNNKIKEYEEKVSSLTNNSSKIDTLNSQITQVRIINKDSSQFLTIQFVMYSEWVWLISNSSPYTYSWMWYLSISYRVKFCDNFVPIHIQPSSLRILSFLAWRNKQETFRVIE